MDPPLRSLHTPLSLTRRKQVNKHLSGVDAMATLHRTVPSLAPAAGSKRRRPSDEADLMPNDTLLQFSYGPATQTTVVTTTTTTTTNLAPLKLKAPGHEGELDPKDYPLASAPTPQSMKRMKFDVDGRPTVFQEVEHPVEFFHEVGTL